MTNRRWSLLLVAATLALVPSRASAQNPTLANALPISTAGTDCAVATNCVGFDVADLPSWTVYLTIGVSGTYNWEASLDATSEATGTWFAVPEDVGGATNTTAGGIKYFTNPGFRRFRARASAISGAGTVLAFRGQTGIRSASTTTATVESVATTGGAVPAKADYIGINISGNIVAPTGFSLGSARAPAMAIVDGSGNQITSFGGGTQYANGAAQATPTGTTALGWDGANVRALNTNSSGSLNVIFPSAQAVNATLGATQNTNLANIDSATSRLTSSATNITAGSALATTSFVTGGRYKSTQDTFTNGQEGSFGMSARGAQYVVPGVEAFTVQPGNTANTTAWLFAGGKTNNNAVPGATNIGALIGVANAAAPTYTETDMVLASLDLHGSTRVTSLDSGGTSTTDATAHANKVEIVDTTGAAVVASSLLTHGVAPTWSTVTGGSLLGHGKATAPTAVTADQAVAPWLDLNGRVQVNGDASMTPLLATLSAETTKVIGTARMLGNAGAAFDAATGAAPPANVVAIGGLTSGATGGFMKIPTVCDSDAVINLATTTATKIVSGVSGRKVHICSIDIGPIAGANNVVMTEGTKVTNECDTGSAGLFGGTTTGSGWNIAANQGVAYGSGFGTIASTATAANDVCLTASANTQVSGHVKYAIW